MTAEEFWLALLAAALGAAIPTVIGLAIRAEVRRRARFRARGQALADLGNAVAINLEQVLQIRRDVKEQRAPRNMLAADGWVLSASRRASQEEHLTADFRNFFEEVRRLSGLLDQYSQLAVSFNLEPDRQKQNALQRMLQELANAMVALCGNLIKNGKYLMDRIQGDPAWVKFRKRNPKPRSDKDREKD